MQIAVGQIARAHGIRGDVTVVVRTDEPDVRFVPGTTLATEPPDRGPLTVAATRWHSGRLIVTFEGVGDRNAAEDLRGTVLVVDSAGIPAPDDPDEFYDHQLIGLSVVTAAGDAVGEVTDVLHHGQDLLVVRRGPGAGGETLIPFVSAIVTDVDVAGGRLVIDPPPGLLDPGEAAEA
ncbi:MAG TPA: ribosome maturation factor RimM [Streptosporangiaceae bacterium]|nr:ribosome maturation factor RimM [Streptosporangiaceae bacterium]